MQTNTPPVIHKILANTGIIGFWHGLSPAMHIAIILGIAIALHLLVKIIRHISEWMINKSHEKKNPFGFVTQRPKFITLTRLIVSAITFVVYFLALGLVLIVGFHFSDTFLKTYLSSAAVIGLALSFGLQGLVQDVVTGVTLIFSDAMDVGDYVDLSGTIGRVEQIGLRFTRMANFYNQDVFVPNRNIGNVSRFPNGGVYAFVNIQIPETADQQKAVETIDRTIKGVWIQFNGIILNEPELGSVEKTPGGWNFLRIRLKIWPGQGGLIETTCRSQMVAVMKNFDPNYADWQVAVTYRAIEPSKND